MSKVIQNFFLNIIDSFFKMSIWNIDFYDDDNDEDWKYDIDDLPIASSQVMIFESYYSWQAVFFLSCYQSR
jgi:hypothetical protein